jgi:hypothetical protein
MTVLTGDLLLDIVPELLVQVGKKYYTATTVLFMRLPQWDHTRLLHLSLAQYKHLCKLEEEDVIILAGVAAAAVADRSITDHFQ